MNWNFDDEEHFPPLNGIISAISNAIRHSSNSQGGYISFSSATPSVHVLDVLDMMNIHSGPQFQSLIPLFNLDDFPPLGGINREELELKLAMDESLRVYQYGERKPEVKIELQPVEYKSLDMKEIDTSCSICMEDYEPDSMVCTTECKHIFHHECIDEWYKYKNECPCCRQQIKTK